MVDNTTFKSAAERNDSSTSGTDQGAVEKPSASPCDDNRWPPVTGLGLQDCAFEMPLVANPVPAGPSNRHAGDIALELLPGAISIPDTASHEDCSYPSFDLAELTLSTETRLPLTRTTYDPILFSRPDSAHSDSPSLGESQQSRFGSMSLNDASLLSVQPQLSPSDPDRTSPCLPSSMLTPSLLLPPNPSQTSIDTELQEDLDLLRQSIGSGDHTAIFRFSEKLVREIDMRMGRAPELQDIFKGRPTAEEVEVRFEETIARIDGTFGQEHDLALGLRASLVDFYYLPIRASKDAFKVEEFETIGCAFAKVKAQLSIILKGIFDKDALEECLETSSLRHKTLDDFLMEEHSWQDTGAKAVEQLANVLLQHTDRPLLIKPALATIVYRADFRNFMKRKQLAKALQEMIESTPAVKGALIDLLSVIEVSVFCILTERR